MEPSEYQPQIKSVKVVIVGKNAVGKSSILIRYVHQKFNNTNTATVGADMLYKQVQCQSQEFKLELWDTAGQQRYKSIVPNFFNLSKAAVVVFDISELKTFSDGQEWLAKLQNHLGNQIPIMILGNKTDLLSQQQLAKNTKEVQEKIKQLKKSFDLTFHLVSAKTNKGIDQAFQKFIKILYERYVRDTEKIPKPKVEKIDLNKPKKPSKKQQDSFWSKCLLI